MGIWSRGFTSVVCLIVLPGILILWTEVADAQLLRPRNVATYDVGVEDEITYHGAMVHAEPTQASVMDDTVFASEPDWGSPVLGGDGFMGCPPRWYAVAEAFALRRNGDSNVTLSNGGRFGGYDYELAGRATIGRTYDCLDGWEASYAGPFLWSQRQGAISDGELQAFLLPGVGLSADDLSAFRNADMHRQYRSSTLHSGEINRRWWGWDVFSLKVGARYLRIEEKFELLSNAGNEFGDFSTGYQNHVGLGQIGLDLMAPVGPWTFGAKVNGGIGLNFNSGEVLLSNNDRRVLGNSSSDEQIAFLAELGIFSIYRLTERISLHAGYEAWYIWGLALPSDQQYAPLNFDSGLSYYERGDLFYHGGTLGVEIVW
jgi:hypothetical protein